VVGRGRDGEEEDGDDDYEMTEHEVVREGIIFSGGVQEIVKDIEAELEQ